MHDLGLSQRSRPSDHRLCVAVLPPGSRAARSDTNGLCVGAALLLVGLLVGAIPVRAQLGLAASEFWEGSVANSRYGAAIALGDIDGDGDLDLAISRPHWTFDGMANHGSVSVILHTAPGEPGTTISRTNCTGPEDHKVNLLFGASLAFGYFNDDAYADLAIGMPGAAAGAASTPGAVCIWYGAAAPVTSTRVHFSQANLLGLEENGDEFGATLAVGDLDGDGFDDLAIGAPGEGVVDDGGIERANAGAVHLIRSHPLGFGLSTLDNVIVHQGQPEAETPEVNERFGSGLAVGHFFLGPAPQKPDLAVGTPGDRGGQGTVTIFAGSSTDPLGTPYAPLHPESLTWDLLGTGVAGDEFGASLVSADFNGDGAPDLAIGIPGDNDLGTATEAGAVMVIYGAGAGGGNLGDTDEQLIYEQILDGSTLGINSFDRFGERLTAADFDLDGFDDLVVGAPFDNSLGFTNAGEVTVIYGSPTGLDVTGHQVFGMVFFDQQIAGDEFGQAVAAGARRAGEGPELLIGLPGRILGEPQEPDFGGVVFIRNQVLFADGFESGDLSRWE